jgi:hypothetical protein
MSAPEHGRCRNDFACCYDPTVPCFLTLVVDAVHLRLVALRLRPRRPESDAAREAERRTPGGLGWIVPEEQITAGCPAVVDDGRWCSLPAGHAGSHYPEEPTR